MDNSLEIHPRYWHKNHSGVPFCVGTNQTCRYWNSFSLQKKKNCFHISKVVICSSLLLHRFQNRYSDDTDFKKDYWEIGYYVKCKIDLSAA
jgi:hypothetical protein